MVALNASLYKQNDFNGVSHCTFPVRAIKKIVTIFQPIRAFSQLVSVELIRYAFY
jgi:hypothetical protein